MCVCFIAGDRFANKLIQTVIQFFLRTFLLFNKSSYKQAYINVSAATQNVFKSFLSCKRTLMWINFIINFDVDLF